jgi:hypothetical protein
VRSCLKKKRRGEVEREEGKILEENGTHRNLFEGLSLVAHACNPNYWVGKDKEDHGLRPKQAKS